MKHRTWGAARKCCERDARAIRSAYPSTYPTKAYSDRVPALYVDGSKTWYSEEQEVA